MLVGLNLLLLEGLLLLEPDLVPLLLLPGFGLLFALLLGLLKFLLVVFGDLLFLLFKIGLLLPVSLDHLLDFLSLLDSLLLEEEHLLSDLLLPVLLQLLKHLESLRGLLYVLLLRLLALLFVQGVRHGADLVALTTDLVANADLDLVTFRRQHRQAWTVSHDVLVEGDKRARHLSICSLVEGPSGAIRIVALLTR